jgi:hypothetical protein
VVPVKFKLGYYRAPFTRRRAILQTDARTKWATGGSGYGLGFDLRLETEVLFNHGEALEEVIDFFGEAGCIAGSFVERLQTLSDIAQFRLDISDARFKRIEASAETALKLLKIVLGGALVFREHPIFDEIDRRENALDIFVHTASVYHSRLGTSKKGSCDGC